MADNLLKQAILTLIGAHGRADLDPVRSFNIAGFQARGYADGRRYRARRRART
ncbi:Uncharacterised protein [Brucella neotomae]|nr:Uncharacterised protein [Brucella neotomae]